MKFWLTIRFFVVFACVSSFAFGQSNSGSITGVVKDAANLPIPNAEVVIVNSATGASVATQTNEQGIYVVSSLNPAPYSVEAKL